MSAFMVGRNHIEYLVESAFNRQLGDGRIGDELRAHYGGFVNDAKAALANELYEENARSMRCRYGHHDEIEAETAFEKWKPDDFPVLGWAVLNPVQLLKSIHCYQYQCCEHKEWEDSRAYSICKQIETHAVREVPGYEKAEWGAPEPTTTRLIM